MDGGGAAHREQGAEHRAGDPGARVGRLPFLDRDVEQPNAKRDAHDGAWQRREHLRDDQPGGLTWRDTRAPEGAHQRRGAPCASMTVAQCREDRV